jgi:uncharacterized damage-inducible protein DinB
MQTHFLKLFHFEFWANKRVLEQLLVQTHVSEKAAQLYAHILFAQKIWLSRIGKVQDDIREDYSKEEFAAILDSNYIELITFIKHHEDFTLDIHYKDLKGNSHKNNLHDVLTHVYVHGAYHRGQIVQLIKQVTQESIVTDFIAYARLEL